MPYKADKRIYLNSDNQVVEEGDPSAARLLVAEGDSIPIVEARKYGLVPEGASDDDEDEQPKPTQPDPFAKSLRSTPANKAVEGPKETK